MPLCRPPTVIGLALPDAVVQPGDAVTTYVGGSAPVCAGGVKEPVAVPVPAVADTAVGAPGSPAKSASDAGATAPPNVSKLPPRITSPPPAPIENTVFPSGGSHDPTAPDASKVATFARATVPPV